MTKPVVHPDVKKKRILHALETWLVEEKEQKKLKALITAMTPKKAAAVKIDAANKATEAPSSLTRYLAWFRGEKQKRTALLQSIVPSSRASDLQTMQASMLRLGRPLTKREARRIVRNNKTLATYLASLSVAQLETYKEALERDVVPLEPRMKKTLTKLFTMLQKEQFAREQDWKKKIGPFAQGVATAVALQQRIAALEKLQASSSRK